MDKLKAIHYFLAVTETDSFSAAARALDVPVSSVSRRVRDLEQELGIELFHRSTRVVQLTELGEIYRDLAARGVATLQHAEELVGEQSREVRGTLVITALPSYGEVVLAPVLERFATEHLDLDLDVRFTDAVLDLSRGEVDLAIRSAGTELPDRVVARKLTDHRFVLVAAPSWLERRDRPPRAVADVEASERLMYRTPAGVLEWHAKDRDSGTWRQLRGRAVLTTDHGRSLLDAALAGRGLALLPAWSVTRELASGALVELELDDATLHVNRAPEPAIYLLYHRPKFQLRKVRAAVDFLLAELVDVGEKS